MGRAAGPNEFENTSDDMGKSIGDGGFPTGVLARR